MVATYLVLVEAAKALFYRHAAGGRPLHVRTDGRERTVRRWTARWTHRWRGWTAWPAGAAHHGPRMQGNGRVRLEMLDRGECLALIATVPVGRIGVSIGALPAILPVNFALIGTTIVFRTVPGTKLDAATRRAVVAFEVDSYAPDGSSGWSVLVQGFCSEITDPAERAALNWSPLRAWPFGDGAADRFVRVETTFVTGRRFGRWRRRA